MNLNKVFLLGRLTVNPQVRSTTSGQSVASFGVATNRVWNDKAGQKQEQVEFHNIVVWGKQAEVASKFLVKGSLVFVEGRLQTRSWEGKDGQQRKTTEIVADRIQLGPRPASYQGGSRSDKGEMKTGETTANSEPDKASPVSQGGEVPTIDIGEEEVKESDLNF